MVLNGPLYAGLQGERLQLGFRVMQGEGEVLRSTRNMIFVQGLVTADAVAAMRISGIFKQGALIGDGSDRDPLQRLV